jgi:SAM-dependent methyltransferase
MTEQQPTDQRAEHARAARSFGPVAATYDRGRPDYPVDAIRWLVGDRPTTVLELGAGTGKLTRGLVEQGHDVFATDPDEAMLEVLRANLPGVRTAVASAEDIPAPDNHVEVVIAAQAFHWFDHERAIPEIARVLRNGGHLALVWNERDQRIPWVRRLGAIIGNQEQLTDPVELVQAPYDHLHWFEPVESREFKHWQVIDPDSLVDLVASRSNVATLSPEAREAKLDEVRAFYADFGRGYDGMQLPYRTECFRAKVIDRLIDTRPPEEPAAAPAPDDGDDGLLIDFR